MEILTAKELAAMLKVSLATLYRMVRDEEIPAFKVANEWRFERSEIEEWIRSSANRFSEEQRQNTTARLPVRAGGGKPQAQMP